MHEGIPDWKYEYFIEQIHRTAYKQHECFVVTSLLHDERLSNLQPRTQYYVPTNTGTYRQIDIFYPQLGLAIEIDEPHHMEYSDCDRKRESEIRRELNCEFRRITISDGRVVDQIEALKNDIIQIRKRRIDENLFEDWTKPKYIDIFELKSEFSNTLFIKIHGEIPPEEYEARQTGYWLINDTRKQNIKDVVVIHDGVIVNVYTHLEWISAPSGKKGFIGKKLDVEWLGVNVTGWTWQNTRTYSDDI